MDRDCNNCVYSTRDGDCRQWKCNNKGWTVEDIKAEAMEEIKNKLINANYDFHKYGDYFSIEEVFDELKENTK